MSRYPHTKTGERDCKAIGLVMPPNHVVIKMFERRWVNDDNRAEFDAAIKQISDGHMRLMRLVFSQLPQKDIKQ